MKRKKTEHFSETWFFKWILNNQAVVAFFILLLIGLTVLIFTKISPIFSPVIQFMTIIMLPLVISMLLYYLIKPLVLLVERTGLNRTMSILVIYAILGLLLVWGISTAIFICFDVGWNFCEHSSKGDSSYHFGTFHSLLPFKR